jgi:FkbM family methyltransferase
MVYLGTYEPWETRVVRRHLKPGMCFVDVGANIGYFSLLASRVVGQTGRVVAFEPSRYAADRLDKALKDNNILNVRLERCALGKDPGEVILYDPLPDNHTPTILGTAGAPGAVVPLRRLDECLSSLRIDRVDLLKIDVEGFELAALQGASVSLREGRIRAIICEFNQDWLGRAGTSSSLLREHILQYGFEDVTETPWDEKAALSNRIFVLNK